MPDADFFENNAEPEIHDLILRLYDNAHDIQKAFALINAGEEFLPDSDLDPLPSNVPPGQHNRVVPLDAAIMAVHLVTARIAFRRIPTIFHDELVKLTSEAVRVAWFPMDLLPKFIGEIAQFITKILAVINLAWEFSKFNDLVDEIRDESRHVRNEIGEIFLSNNNPRARRAVLSRHNR